MKKIQILLFTFVLSCAAMGQRVTITADSLLHYLQQAEDIYACFDYQTKDPVVGDFSVFYDQKDFYHNDTLKHLLINLFNDSIGWAKYEAKRLRQNYENKPEENKRLSLEGYLEQKYKKSFVDSILNSERLFNQYYDSLCAYEEESSFKEDIKKRGTWNVPYSLKNIIAYSRYPEIYDKMLYYWKDDGMKLSIYYDYLLNVDCPEVISIIESDIDNNKNIGKGFVVEYRSEAIRLLMKTLDKTYLVPMNLEDYSVPLNVKCIGFSWLSKYHYGYRWGKYDKDIEKITYKIIDDIWQIMERDCSIKPNDKEWRRISKEIIENKQYILKFLEPHYQKCLEEELYWKQNMPYYKRNKQ